MAYLVMEQNFERRTRVPRGVGNLWGMGKDALRRECSRCQGTYLAGYRDCISAPPAPLARGPCTGNTLHYGLRGGALTAPISPSHSGFPAAAHQVLLRACWPGFLAVCQLSTALHSSAADTSASSLLPFLPFLLQLLFLSGCQ